jgi:hypothetical protein
MEPYRPLYVVNEREDPTAHELRGLAVLLVVLGALRIIPALVRGETLSTESALATAMLAVGVAIVLRAPRRWHLLRRRVRRTIMSGRGPEVTIRRAGGSPSPSRSRASAGSPDL